MSRTASREFERSRRAGAPDRRPTPAPGAAIADAPGLGPPPGPGRTTSIPRRKPHRRVAQWIISILIAGTVGVAGFLAGGFEYRASVDLVVTNTNVAAAELDGLRRDLLDHTWKSLGASAAPWRVELDAEARSLSVTLASPDPEQARAALTQLTGGFVDQIRALVERARTQPGPDEVVLAEFRKRLQDELLTLTGDVQRIESSLPRDDCEAIDTELRGRLSARRSAYEQNRARVRTAEAQLAAILDAPLPERAVVDPETRARTIRADVEAQQDLKALRVQLAELRHQLLKVREATSPILHELGTSAGELEALCSGTEARSADLELRRTVERVGQFAIDYHALLREFAQAWTAEFDRLDTLQDDLQRAEVLDVQGAVEDAVSGFIFRSSVPLGAIREQVRLASAAAAAAAQYHELASSLVRAFHALQTAHHRFEFTAADVKPSNNFRLDAALKSAKGLRHRSRKRLAQIEGCLARRALENLRTQRTGRVAALKREIDELREALDASMEAAWAVQERVSEHTPALHNYRQSQTVAGVYEERAKSIRADLGQIETRLNDLAARRMDVINPDHLEVASCRVDRWPVNLPAKLLQGSLAAGAALVLLIGLQTWLSPKVL